MGFVVSLVAGALSLGAVGTAVLEIGAGVGLGLLSRSLRKKNKGPAAQRGQNLQLRIGTNLPKVAIIGRAPTGGSLVYWQCKGTNNETVQMVVALADHECHGLAEIWVDGKKRAWDADTGIVEGFDGKLKIRFYSGTGTQTVDTAVRDASAGRWTDNDRGIGVCYAVVEATEDENVFKGGMPQIVYVVDGAKLYDRRKDSTVGGFGPQRWNDPSTWTFSRNPAVAADNVLRFIPQNGGYLFGMRAPADTIRSSDLEASANVCDEAVYRKDGATEARYECGFTVDVGPGHHPERTALENIIEAMAGDIITTGGIYRVMAGASQPSVATLTDADFVPASPLVRSAFLPRTELVNAIAASYSNPAEAYALTPLPLRFSSADELADGGNRWTRAYDLSSVQSRAQAQRIQEYRRREARRQGRASGELRAKWFVLEAGDWVTINSARAGWSNRTFRIGPSSEGRKLTTQRAFIEVDNEIDDWDSSWELDDTNAVDLPSAGPTMSQVADWNVEVVTRTGGDGTESSGLRFTWAPITDRTVTALQINYRRQGDTSYQTVYALDVASGELIDALGIPSGVIYEAQAVGITTPTRPFDYTVWKSTAGAVPTQIVGVAMCAQDVTPGIIDADDLDEQSRFLLHLAALTEEANYGVAHAIAELRNEVQTLGEAVLSNRIESNSTTANARTAIRLHQTLSESYASYVIQTDTALEGKASASSMLLLEDRVTDVEGEIEAQAVAILAAQAEIEEKASADSVVLLGNRVTSAEGTLTAHSSAIASAQAAIDNPTTGLSAQYSASLGLTSRVEETEEGLYYAEQAAYLTLTNDGHVTGLAGLYGDGITTQFIVLADKFAVAHPSGSYAHNPFVVATNAYGSGLVSINGDLLASGTVRAEAIHTLYLSTLSSDMGSIRAGDMQSNDGKVLFDLNNRIFQMDFD